MSELTVWAKAKAEIDRRGWHQGWYVADEDPDRRGDCAVCVLGAVFAAACGNPMGVERGYAGHDEAEHAYGCLVDALSDRGFDGVSGFNDDPDRTVDDVYALLDELDAAERGAS